MTKWTNFYCGAWMSLCHVQSLAATGPATERRMLCVMLVGVFCWDWHGACFFSHAGQPGEVRRGLRWTEAGLAVAFTLACPDRRLIR